MVVRYLNIILLSALLLKTETGISRYSTPKCILTKTRHLLMELVKRTSK